ncbi:hypothetical protein [Caldimonas sp. KR1-144]|uniref:hypothetical protein n=1 Tax=Caldimonas sp. KR1-144 TaxID=3400911 RepID=UPI003BFC88DD
MTEHRFNLPIVASVATGALLLCVLMAVDAWKTVATKRLDAAASSNNPAALLCAAEGIDRYNQSFCLEAARAAPAPHKPAMPTSF